jgi:hypothetical protein
MTCLLRGAHDLADKAAWPLGAAMTWPDAARSDPDLIVTRSLAGALHVLAKQALRILNSFANRRRPPTADVTK